MPCTVAAFWGSYKHKTYPESYNEEDLETLAPYLGDKNHICYNLKGEVPRGKLCNAGFRSAVIKPDGTIVRCKYAPDEILGNIANNDIRLLTNPGVCAKHFCPHNEFDTVIET